MPVPGHGASSTGEIVALCWDVRTPRLHGAFVTIAVPVDFADEALTTEIADDLAVVEVALREASFGGDEMFTEVSRHMMEAGGKRFRAMLVLLAARFGDCRDKRIVPAAVAIELTHLATLFHDDVMDEADMRRGQAPPTGSPRQMSR